MSARLILLKHKSDHDTFLLNIPPKIPIQNQSPLKCPPGPSMVCPHFLLPSTLFTLLWSLRRPAVLWTGQPCSHSEGFATAVPAPWISLPAGLCMIVPTSPSKSISLSNILCKLLIYYVFIYFLSFSAGLLTLQVEEFLFCFLIHPKYLELHFKHSRCLYKYLLNKWINCRLICGLACWRPYSYLSLGHWMTKYWCCIL